MKKMKTLLFAALFCVPLVATADVEINETNFPDEIFRKFLLESHFGEDGVITDDELKAVTTMQVDQRGIRSLKGIEFFTALTYLRCSENQLTALDVSKNTALTQLYCHENQLTTLDVSKNTVLVSLDCDYNQLTALDVSNNTVLRTLECSKNQLTALDVSKNTALASLRCHGNQLTALDVSKNTALTSLRCNENQLTALDVSKNTALIELQCYKNQIKGGLMNVLISSLPQNTTGETRKFYVYAESEPADGNVITKSQVAAAKARGWTPYYLPMNEWDWTEYEGMDGDAPASVALPEVENGTAEIYNLAGQRVTASVKGGIYVVGGKKVVVR